MEKKCNFLRMFSTPKFVRIYVFFKKIMGSTRSHPLPVEMPATSNEFDDWTEKDFDEEIDRLNKRLKELDSERVQVQATPEDDEEYDSDDIMNDPDVREMVECGEHICHMFDGECLACEMDEEDEVRVLTEEEVQNDPEMTAQVGKVAHFC